MVNPNKHANNLNEDDLEYIYDRLNRAYDEADDFQNKKQINQQIIVFLLTCKRFSPQNLIRLPYLYFSQMKKNDLLYKPIERHITNNYCQRDGLLLTDSDDNAYTADNINQLLSRIDTGKIRKEVSVETLNKTKSRFNDYGKKIINKRELKETLNKIETSDKREVIADKATDIEDANKEDKILESHNDDMNFEELSEKLSRKVMDKIQSDENELSLIKKQLNEIIEKQNILEDSLSNKHNQLSNTVKKIHQNIKASNNKYNQLDAKFKQLPLIEDKINTILDKQDDGMDELYSKLDNIIETREENIIYTEETVEEIEDKPDTSIVSTDKVNTSHDNHQIESDSEKISCNEYKEFMFKWFTNNMKITRSPYDTVDISEITNKVDKYIDANEILIDKDALYNRLESYLKYWYNSYNRKIDFNVIKNESIRGTEMFSYLQFIDIKQERENRIKNSIITWLKEHTREVNGAKTYTQDIFIKLQPIFEENGWIITDNDEWKELHEAGYTKICPNRTFSQIIGKSVQEVYESINKHTIQRDSPAETGFVTWYPNIDIIEKELSDDVHSKIKNELSDEIFESDNLIYNWLKDNIIFTGNDKDSITIQSLLERVRKYLIKQEITISDDNLETVFTDILCTFLKMHSINFIDSDSEICQVTLKGDFSDRIVSVITKWLENHIVATENVDDRLYLEDIHDKLSSVLYSEGLTIVPENVYFEIPLNIRDNFINESRYVEEVDRLLDSIISSDKVEDSLGTYYESLKIVRFSLLTDEVLQDWIDKNVSIINKPIVLEQHDLCQMLEEYMKENNVRNCSEVSTMELLDENIRKYYEKNSTSDIQVLQDLNCNKFYLGIAIEL